MRYRLDRTILMSKYNHQRYTNLGEEKTMKSCRKELWFNIPSRRGFKNITPDVETALQESGIQEGFVLVSAMHITASVFINDDESGLHQDYEKWLEKLAPHEPVSHNRHNDTGEDNADAHMKRQIMGREVVVAVTVVNLTSVPGSKFSTVNSMDEDVSGCW